MIRIEVKSAAVYALLVLGKL
jgi:hypothetical protein